MRRAQRRKYHYFYKTTCIITNKYYYGMHSTDNLDDGYLGSGKRLWYSINKHGRENHICEKLKFFDTREKLRQKEIEFVNEDLLKDPLCMNLIVGGGAYNNGWKKFNSDSVIQKIKSDKGNLKLKWLFENDKNWCLSRSKKIGAKSKGNKVWLGKHHTNETKEKMRNSHLGKNVHNINFRWVCNKNEIKKIPLLDLDFYLKLGWQRGRKYK